ncbi:MAG: alpha/beta hydrolase [Myxococcota bacterium]|nr:alpha/beta hydrolase [Myxococcota bacterium]
MPKRTSEKDPLPGATLLATAARHEVSVPGARLSYQVIGEGPALLFIMGFLARGLAWRHQLEALAPRWRCIIFDNRGIGESHAERQSSGMHELAEDALAVLNHAGEARAHIVGVSMGGMIAQRLVLMTPEKVKSLSLLVTHPGGLHRVIPPRRGWLAFLRAQRARESADHLSALLQLLCPPARLAAMGTAERMRLYRCLDEDFSPTPSPETRRAQLSAIIRFRAASELHKVQCPTLIAQAGEDRLISPRHSETLARLIPQSVLHAFPEQGHGLIRGSVALNQALEAHFLRAEASWARL